MEESGVSKQVSVRFEDVSEDGHIRPQDIARKAPASEAASTDTDAPPAQRRAA
jgi:hypothetical protein